MTLTEDASLSKSELIDGNWCAVFASFARSTCIPNPVFHPPSQGEVSRRRTSELTRRRAAKHASSHQASLRNTLRPLASSEYVMSQSWRNVPPPVRAIDEPAILRASCAPELYLVRSGASNQELWGQPRRQ